MLVTKTSGLTGAENTLEINITLTELREFNNRGHRRAQDVMPHLSPEQREFLMTGISPQEWNELIANTEDDNA